MQKTTGTKTIIKKLSDSRWFWMVLSLLAAIFIWAYYGTTLGTEMTRTFYGVEITYSGEETMRESLSLIISQEETTSVNITLTGSRRDITKLTATDLKAVVNLSGVTRAGYRSMPYTISYPSSVNSASITIDSQAPQTVGLTISKLATKTVQVVGHFVGTVMDGYAIDSTMMTFDPAYVTLIGPEEELEEVTSANVVIDRDNVNASFTATANFTLTDADGAALTYDDIQMDTETVNVTVPISMTKEVNLDVTLIAGGGATADDIVKEISPSTITLAGDAATLEAINTISLATIDLSEYTSFPATEYQIVLPNGTENLSGETTATVSLNFTGLSTSLFTVTNLDYINLTNGYTASIMPANLIVTIRAPEEVLGLIASNNIRAVADLTDITTTSRAPVTIYVDGYEEAGAVGDYTMYVQVKPSNEG